ncbi:MAG: protein kinase domain-containing protein, partial [Polyangiaceae bacterium]
MGDRSSSGSSLETGSLTDDSSSELAPDVDRDFPIVSRHNYEIGEELARGGNGRLLRARDRRLDRMVAIKEPRELSSRVRRRFRREALLTARLQHPSIVPVHEIGRWPSGEPFYAMKLISGRSLRDVVAEATTLEKRLALLPNVLAVADAIAYAHGQGVIHRDLKTSNVMVGAFGETQVIDWGLAQELGAHDDAADDGVPAAAFETQGIVGTPATMAPEQATGKRLDERTDVYGIGAILYQVIAGALPYDGEDAREVLARVVREPPPPLGTRAPDAPRELVTIAEHAMARDPAERYPSARELADDLRRFLNGQIVRAHRYSPLQRARRLLRRNARVLGIAAATAVAAAAIAGVTVYRVHPPPPPPCQGAEAAIAQVWSAARASDLERALRATGSAQAADAFQRVRGLLDRYASSWTAMHRSACEATRVQSEEALDLRMACLTQRKRELGATVDLLLRADSEMVDRGPEGAARLEAVDSCADVASLRSPFAPPKDPAQSQAVEDLRRRIADVDALENAGRYPAALAVTPTLVEDARRVGYAPLLAEAIFHRAIDERKTAQQAAALRSYFDAAVAAEAAKDDVLAARIWMLRAIAQSDLSTELADRDADLANASIVRSGDSVALRAQLLRARAWIAYRRGDSPRMKELAEQALAIDERLLGANDPETLAARSVVADALFDLGDFDQAVPAYRAIYDGKVKLFGITHPDAVRAAEDLGAIFVERGDYSTALKTFQALVALPGNDTLRLAYLHTYVGASLIGVGRIGEGLAEYAKGEGYARAWGQTDGSFSAGDMSVALSQRHEDAAAEAAANQALSVPDDEENGKTAAVAFGVRALCKARRGDARGAISDA